MGLVFEPPRARCSPGYARHRGRQTGIVGTFGGINIVPPVTDFMNGFIAGVNYCNEQQGADVRVLGGRDPATQTGTSPATSTSTGRQARRPRACSTRAPTSSFRSPDRSASARGRDRGQRALTGRWASVSTSTSSSAAPDTDAFLLTSVMKRMDNAVFDAVERAA